MATNVKQVIQDLIIPEFRTLSVEIKRLDEKIEGVRSEFGEKFKRLDEKINVGLTQVNEKIDVGLRQVNEKIDTGLRRLDEKIDNLDKRFSSEIRRLDDRIELLREEIRNLKEEFHLAIDIHERLSYLEAKLGK